MAREQVEDPSSDGSQVQGPRSVVPKGGGQFS